MNLQWPDVTMITDEVRQCIRCGEFRTVNHIYRDLDHEGNYYCGKCAFWSSIPQKAAKFIIITFPTYEQAG